MKRIARITAGVCLAMLGGGMGCEAAGAPEDAAPVRAPILSTEISGKDLEFFTGAGPEIALMAGLSGLAKERAVTPEVKAEAGMVWKEQMEEAVRLKALASQMHVPVSEDPNEAGRKKLKALGELTGVKFDKTFLDEMGDAREALEANLQEGAASEASEIKAFAEAGLGRVKVERERVRKLGF